jgi:hypothetical protein
VVLENRFDPRSSSDAEACRALAQMADIYCNDARHLPPKMPTYASRSHGASPNSGILMLGNRYLVTRQ